MINDTAAAPQKSRREVLLEFQDLRARLDEAEQTLEAIRSGDVDALVVYGEQGEKVYTLKGADEPYRIFVEQMNEGALTLSLEGTILYSNQSFAAMTGLALEKVIGSSVYDLVFTPEGDRIDQFLAKASQDNARAEMVVLRPGGELPVVVSCSKIEEEGPSVFAITVTNLKIQRDHEIQLRKANEELEGFCYSVSHDLRAPLRNIISAAHIVLEDSGPQLSKEAYGDLQNIAGLAGYLGKLIDDLLLYARLSHYPLALEEVDLTNLAHSIADEIDSEDEGRRTWSIEEGMHVQADPRLIRLVLENLMSNAAKYSAKREGPQIQVATIPWEDGTAFLVRDNGIGFEMTYLDKLFQPFERLHRQEEYPGTGIGLASASRIVGRHGGSIWAESQPDKGATFYFSIPLETPRGDDRDLSLGPFGESVALVAGIPSTEGSQVV